MLSRPAIIRGTLILSLSVVGAAGQAMAQGRGSMEDQMACTPDVYRLCSSYVPNEDAIVGCLRRNVRGLSPACQKVFTRPDTPANGDQNDDD